MIFHFDADGTGWKELNVMREGEMIYSAINRYETGFKYNIDEQGKIEVVFDEGGNDEKLQFNGEMLTYVFDDVPTFVHTTRIHRVVGTCFRI